MNKRDLAYVLVKLMGFSWILLTLFSSIGRLVDVAWVGSSNSTLGSAARSMSLIPLLTALLQIVLALLVIKKAEIIVRWLLADDRT